MPRIFLEQALREGARIELPAAAARHLLQVLRLRAGDAFVAFNGEGGEFEARIETAGRRDAVARIGTFRNVDRESPLSVTLAQCVSKGERMDYSLQKAVELGVAAVQPLLSGRSVVRVDEERWEKKHEHWRGVIVSACEQCGRTRVPPLAPVVPLTQWLGTATDWTRLVLDPVGGESLQSLSVPRNAPVVLLVGPEGGLTEQELGAARRAGFTGLKLGPRVLRTETAGVAALAALQAMWGDLK